MKFRHMVAVAATLLVCAPGAGAESLQEQIDELRAALAQEKLDRELDADDRETDRLIDLYNRDIDRMIDDMTRETDRRAREMEQAREVK